MAGMEEFFKKSVVEKFTVANVNDLVVGMIFALLISLFILFIYRTTFRGVVYNHNFGVSLVVLSAISCLIISTISSNLVLSLGLVGALSLIRFRTAVKDPIDIVFLFWAISSGIACGAARYTFALIGALFIGILLMVLNMFNLSSATYLLVIRCEKSAEADAISALGELKYKIKSKTATKERAELTVEIKMKDNNTAFVDKVAEINGVTDAVLVSYNGDYAE
jgi:hypothetical protein